LKDSWNAVWPLSGHKKGLVKNQPEVEEGRGERVFRDLPRARERGWLFGFLGVAGEATLGSVPL
jgi:hypothetical protein